MTEVTDVIVARRAQPESFTALLIGSLIAHVMIVGLLLFGPFDWHVEAEAPRSVMTISLRWEAAPRRLRRPKPSSNRSPHLRRNRLSA
jgi:membrane protein implicated in regulation of membrane protease activity